MTRFRFAINGVINLPVPLPSSKTNEYESELELEFELEKDAKTYLENMIVKAPGNNKIFEQVRIYVAAGD